MRLLMVGNVKGRRGRLEDARRSWAEGSQGTTTLVVVNDGVAPEAEALRIRAIKVTERRRLALA